MATREGKPNSSGEPRFHGSSTGQGPEFADQFVRALGHGGIRQWTLEVPLFGGLCGTDRVGAVVGDLNGLILLGSNAVTSVGTVGASSVCSRSNSNR